MKAGFSFFFFIFSLVFTYMSFNFEFLSDSGRPGAGFFPIIIGVLLLVFSGTSFIKDIREKDTDKSELGFAKDILLLIVMMALMIFLLKWIGAVLSMVLFIFVILFKFNREKMLLNIIVSICFPLIIFAMFDLWLNAGLPKGFLGFI